MPVKRPSDGGVVPVLSRIAEKRRELDRLDDEFATLISRVESSLREVGVAASVVIAQPLFGVGPAKRLAYAKHGGTWRIVIEEGGTESVPLASADRNTRFSVFKDGHLEKLVGASLDKLESAIADRARILPTSMQFVDGLDGGGSKP